jgi:hypothetical protein
MMGQVGGTLPPLDTSLTVQVPTSSSVYPATLSVFGSIRALYPPLTAAGEAGFASATDFRGLEDVTTAPSSVAPIVHSKPM